MENKFNHTDMAEKAMLKEKALPYLPRNLSETTAQRQIMQMIAKAVPSVASFINQADLEIWPKVNRGELPISNAIAQCAYRVDTIIETASYQEQALRALTEEDLLKLWIALDYYAYVLKAEFSVHILQLQKSVTNALLTENAPHAEVVSYDVTAPVEPPVIPVPELPVIPAFEQPTVKKEKVKNIAKPVVKQKQPKEKGNGQKDPKKLVLISAALLCVVLLVIFLSSDVRQTKSAINKIGVVSLESEAQILKAEELYAELKENQKEKVKNYDELTAARTEYDALVTEDAIEKIGKVTLESQDAIVKAEELYENLSRDAKNLVDNYKTLTSARKEYDRLNAAVQDASDAIDAIGTVTLQSGDKIEKARKAYDSLKKDNLQKYLSDKVSKLTNAEKEYKELVSEDLYATGLAHYEKKSYEEAINCFDTIIADYSDTKALENAKKTKADSQIALADQAYGKRDYYTAMKTLSSVEAKYQQENYKKVQEKTISAINKARPRNGAQIAGNINWGYCYINITASKQDVCFKFESKSDPKKYKIVFVRAGETAKVNFADGEYSVKFVTGTYWYGKDIWFGDDSQYRAKGSVDFETTHSGNWVYYWHYNFDMTDSGFSSYSISANEF